MIAIIVVIAALILLALINTGMGKVTEMADEADTKQSHGCALVFAILLILVVLALTGVALNETVPKRPGSDRTQIVDVIVRETPQNERPAQWSNAYWENRAATREARDAQYRP